VANELGNPHGDAHRIPIAELRSGQAVDGCYACSEAETASDRNGKTFLRLRLRDATGDVKAIHFDPSDEALGMAPGDIAVVSGTFSVHPQYGPQVQIRRLRLAEADECDLSELIPVSPIDAGELAERLHALVDSVSDANLRDLLDRAFDGTREPGAAFATAPAAIRNHHAYRHGLLEHSVVVAECAAGIAARFAVVNRDLVVAGALLHDVGKTRTYSSEALSSSMTDVGRLHGEIVIGQTIVARLIDEIPDFPDELAMRLLHVVISHHGQREKGSPAVPMTREAIIVHYCDDLTARLAAIDEAARSTPPGDSWSGRISMIDASAYLGVRPEQDD
jgi:3'-5' exoribonuclease